MTLQLGVFLKHNATVFKRERGRVSPSRLRNTGNHKTRQEKWNKTRRDEARQGKTRPDETRRHETRRDEDDKRETATTTTTETKTNEQPQDIHQNIHPSPKTTQNAFQNNNHTHELN
jgi:hypothetical protein